MYPREQYLKEIISKKDNGRIKIITGLRRSGKSVLLFQLYREWLLGEGVKEDQIIALALDILENARYRNPLELDKYVRDHMVNPKKRYYIFIDEIRFVSEIQNPYVDNKDAKMSLLRKQLEVDFVVNQGGKRFYIQSALSIADPDKKEQEIESLKRIPDSFSKMVVVRDYLKPWQDENGITYVGIEQFLLNEELLK